MMEPVSMQLLLQVKWIFFFYIDDLEQDHDFSL